MPTQEERLSDVEKAIGELNTNSTILLGLASDHEIDIRRVAVQITELRAEMNERLNRMDMRLDTIIGELAIIRQALEGKK